MNNASIIECAAEEREYLRSNLCPDCKCSGFLEGPSGGECVNIKCANPCCGSEFNIGPLSAQRISEPGPLGKP